MKAIILIVLNLFTTFVVASAEQPKRIEIDAQFVLFKTADILKLAEHAPVTMSGLKELRSQGKAELLCSPLHTTKISGAQTSIKSVSEYIYPTAFEYKLITSDKKDHPIDEEKRSFQPVDFQTREVGSLLEVLPEVNEKGIIVLTMTPQLIYPTEPKTFTGTLFKGDKEIMKVPLEEPTFRVFTTTACGIPVADGETVFFGGLDDEDKKTTLYIFVTARLVAPRSDTKPEKEEEVKKANKPQERTSQ